jgi:AraC family transcriptional activator of mtrCDE
MESIDQIKPVIRVAHHYDFPYERNPSEKGRYGYCYAFHWITGGRGRVTVPGATYSVKKGDLLYFQPQLAHSFYSDPEQPLSSYNIYCDLWATEPVDTEIHLVWNPSEFDPNYLTRMLPCEELSELPHYLPLQHHDALAQLFAHIVKHHHRVTRYSRTIVSSLLKAFVLELVQLPHDDLLTDYRMKPIMDRIDREANAGSRYEKWIEQSGLKKTQFHELFRKASGGLSPKAYWTRAIMKQAVVALLESNRTITQLSDDLGYSSIHHFTKQFTAYYGVSPSVYRKQRR